MSLNLTEFAEWCVRNGCWEGCDLDGGELQDKALECGILVETKYDPQKHGHEYLSEVDEGDTWYAFSDEFKAALLALTSVQD